MLEIRRSIRGERRVEAGLAGLLACSSGDGVGGGGMLPRFLFGASCCWDDMVERCSTDETFQSVSTTSETSMTQGQLNNLPSHRILPEKGS